MQFSNIFLQLVRLGIGHGAEALSGSVNWNEVQALAERQGLAAVLLDGIELLTDCQRPPKNLLLQWIGDVLQSYKYRYELYRRAIAELAGFYREHALKMMVLKGYACSLNWPKPEHRPCGDIDIWMFGKQKESDDTLQRAQGSAFKIDTSHHHHTVFYWRDFMVENHYDFVNVHAHKSSAELEKIFKYLGDERHIPSKSAEDSNNQELENERTSSLLNTNGTNITNVLVKGEKVYLPSPNLHALFLIKHMVSHFAAAEITLRQVLDWAFFVENHTKDIDWEWLLVVLEKYHMKEFFNLINAICVDDLGFGADIFPTVQFLPELKERVLEDILDPAFTAAEPKVFLPRMIYKYKRWQGNAWKQKLCYSESRWEMFRMGIWAKILKPASI